MEGNENKEIPVAAENTEVKSEETPTAASDDGWNTAPAVEKTEEQAAGVSEESSVEETAATAESVDAGVVAAAETSKDEKKDFSIDTEKIKSETSSTINEVRETIKKVNLKDDTEATKGFLLKFIQNPINEMKDIANSDNTFLKTAVVLLIVWTAAAFAKEVFYVINLNSISGLFRYGLLDSLISIVMTTIAPCVSVIVLSVIIMVINKENKKSLVSIITTVTLARIPTILAAVLSVLTVISSQITKITSPFASLCQIVSTVLLYFGMKEMFKSDDDNSFIKTFVLVEVIYFIAKFILSFLSISI